MAESVHKRFDVAVVGGGPAGSLVAAGLAQSGHSTVLLDRPFSRTNPVETLTPQAATLLCSAAHAAILRRALLGRADYSRILWRSVLPEFVSGREKPVYFIDRNKLDHDLRTYARDRGSALCITSGSCKFEDTGAKWLVTGRDGVQKLNFSADYLVDARGRSALNAADVASHYTGNVAWGVSWDVGCTQENGMYIEALREGWLWGVELASGYRCLELFQDRDATAGMKHCERQDRLRQVMASSRLFRDWLSTATIAKIRVRDATQKRARQPVASNFLRVGDACLATDPVSAQGLSIAIRGAVQAIGIINTQVRRSGQELAQQFCIARQEETFAESMRMTGKIYADHEEFKEADFWRKRALVDAGKALPEAPDIDLDISKYCQSRRTVIRQEPVLNGGFIESRAVLLHPNLSRPVGFVQNYAIADFVSAFREPLSFRDACGLLHQRLDDARAVQLLSWCVGKGILTRAD